jgi:hypothetical protein
LDAPRCYGGLNSNAVTNAVASDRDYTPGWEHANKVRLLFQ